MSYGPTQVFNISGVASGTTNSTFVDLGGKSFTKLAVKYPTSMSTGAMLTVFGCDTSTGTYLPIYEQINSTTVQYRALTIATSTSGGWAVLDAPPFQYLKFCASAAVTDGGGTITIMVKD